MNKRGEEDTMFGNIISLLIAVLGMSLLVFVVIYWVGNFSGQEKKNAENTLDLIMTKLNLIEDSGKYSYILQGFGNSNNWFLAGWSAGEAERPDKCYFESCLCICNKNTEGSKDEEKCQKAGICKSIKYDRVSILDFNSAKPEDQSVFSLPVNSGAYELEVIFNSDKTKYATIYMNSTEQKNNVEISQTNSDVTSKPMGGGVK